MTTVALVQKPGTEHPDVAVESAVHAVRSAAEREAQVVVLPELFRSLYFPQREDPALFDLAETIPGPTTETLGALARELEIVIVGSVFERRTAGLYHNTAVVFDADGRLAGVYRKAHIPHDPGFYEKYYFTPGDTPIRAIETRYLRIAPLVCWDQWFPEAARLAALDGAELIAYPTAIGWDCDAPESLRRAERDAWRTVQRAHAITSGVFVAAVNRVGREQSLEFWGSSFVADPFGRVIAEAGTDAETILIANCDRREIEATRRTWPFLRDRRPDLYGSLTLRFGADESEARNDTDA